MRARPLTLTLALVMLAAACGSGSGMANVVVAAASETASAKTFRFASRTELGGETLTVIGAVDLERDLMWMGQDEGPDTEPQQILAGEKLYLPSSSVPPGSSEPPTPWIVYELGEDAIAGLTGADEEAVAVLLATMEASVLPPFDTRLQVDPATLLDQLGEDARSVSELGDQTIRGVPTQGYRVAFDSERLNREATKKVEQVLDNAPSEMRESLEPFVRSLRQREIPEMDVWVGGDGLIRRIRQKYDGSQLSIFEDTDETFFGNERTQGAGGSFELDFFDFGAAVNVDIPSSDQVTPAEELWADMAEGGGTLDESGFPEPVGEWTLAQEGTFRGVTWRLFSADATLDGICLAFETDDQQSSDDAFWPDDRYQGKSPSCGPRADAFDASSPLEFYEESFDGSDSFNVLAGSSMEGVERIGVRYADGREEIVPTMNATFVVVYDRDEEILSLHPDVGPGGRVVCKPYEDPDFPSFSCSGSVGQ